MILDRRMSPLMQVNWEDLVRAQFEDKGESTFQAQGHHCQDPQLVEGALG